MRTWNIGQWLGPAAFLLGILIPHETSAVSTVQSERDYFGVIADRLGRRDAAKPPHIGQGEPIDEWSTAANDAMALDHTSVAANEKRVFGENVGPARSARALAIIHIAMFEALNAINHKYASYTGVTPVAQNVQVDERAAVAKAAYDTMSALYPSQEPRFKSMLDDYLGNSIREPSTLRGIDLGHTCAMSILNLRVNDGSNHAEPLLGVDYQTGNDPGQWTQDPIAQQPIALGAFWGRVKPFVLSSSSQFRAPPPPALSSIDYKTAFNEVFRLGGHDKPRTAEQTVIGKYWNYEGTPHLGTSPRLYNQITLVVAKQMGTKGLELARLTALVNVALADAGIALWESKYTYAFWRPVTAIRARNLALTWDFTDFTPPFPAYPSDHAGFGGALFQILRRFYRTDRIPFAFVSDEFNGVTKDSDGTVRPLVPRSFQTLSQAEEENGQSRIYLGIHWRFDKTAGITQGHQVADRVFNTTFLPLP